MAAAEAQQAAEDRLQKQLASNLVLESAKRGHQAAAVRGATVAAAYK